MLLAVEEMPHGNDISGGATEWRGMYIRPYINNNNQSLRYEGGMN